MFQDQVFCFTPKGKLIALPRGATPIDFAYAVHSQVGDTCVGAKINGRSLAHRVQRTRADVSVDDAKGEEGKREKAAAGRFLAMLMGRYLFVSHFYISHRVYGAD